MRTNRPEEDTEQEKKAKATCAAHTAFIVGFTPKQNTELVEKENLRQENGRRLMVIVTRVWTSKQMSRAIGTLVAKLRIENVAV